MLVQRSLFDRRVERQAAAQQRLAAEALRACAERVSQLEGVFSLTVQRRDLAFAVVLE
jgi:hypothetical protein